MKLSSFKFLTGRKKRFTIDDFINIDGYFYVGNHYDVDGDGWVTLDELEDILIEAPYGYKNYYMCNLLRSF